MSPTFAEIAARARKPPPAEAPVEFRVVERTEIVARLSASWVYPDWTPPPGSQLCPRCGWHESKSVPVRRGHAIREDCSRCGLGLRFSHWEPVHGPGL